MQLGWIDFSKTERNKIMSVFDLLGEKGVLDELGISSIRDVYSNLFFPGTSTIQTRAKYFLIVPYAFKDLEYNNQLDYFKLKKTFDNTEEDCGRRFFQNNPDEDGVIGKRSLQSNKWVQRTPSNIYWAGLRKYGIFNAKMSITEYIKLISIQKQNKNNSFNLGNRNDNNESKDDKNADSTSNLHLLNIPTYNRNWFDKLDINLTFDEGQFLKNQIIETCKGSMFAFILRNDMWEVLDIDSFSDLKSIIYKFPEDIQENYKKASAFSEFNYILRIIYNLIVSDNKNEKAIKEFGSIDFEEVSNIDIDDIMNSLCVYNHYLRNFLNKSKELMQKEDIDDLKDLIKSREVWLKGANRAKTSHPGEFDVNLWFAGERLDYRFTNAKNILEDIYESEKNGGGD